MAVPAGLRAGTSVFDEGFNVFEAPGAGHQPRLDDEQTGRKSASG